MESGISLTSIQILNEQGCYRMLLGAPGLTTRRQNATSNTTRNKKLVGQKHLCSCRFGYIPFRSLRCDELDTPSSSTRPLNFRASKPGTQGLIHIYCLFLSFALGWRPSLLVSFFPFSFLELLLNFFELITKRPSKENHPPNKSVWESAPRSTQPQAPTVFLRLVFLAKPIQKATSLGQFDQPSGSSGVDHPGPPRGKNKNIKEPRNPGHASNNQIDQF